MNELERLESIIAHDLARFLEHDCRLEHALIDDFKAALAEETENIKSRIALKGSRVGKKAELKRYISFHQQCMISLSSRLTNYCSPEKIPAQSMALEVSVLCHHIYKSLEDLLLFIERHFTAYFNQDAWVPASYRQIAVQEIGHEIKKLERALTAKSVDTKLVKIIFQAFQDFLAPDFTHEVTYRQVRFMKALKAELVKVLKVNSPDTMNEKVRHLLLSMNLNSSEYFVYLTNHIAGQITEAEDHTRKLEQLSYSLKEVNQVRERPNLCYDPRYRPLKEQIVNWIAEELHFQEKTYQLTLAFREPETTYPPAQKLQLDLSVAQLACLLRGFVEEGVIQNKNLLDLFKLMAGITKSKRSETISPESLRMRYYNIEHSARTTIITRLRTIADKLSKES